MAAATATIRNYLRDVIGIADVTGNIHARRDAIRSEGLNAMGTISLSSMKKISRYYAYL